MKYLFALLILFSVTPNWAQYTREDAREDLMQLKNGMLLVRLLTNQTAIESLEAQGRSKEAERLRQQQYLENKEIVLSFSKAFDFCPVYFFYSDASPHIRKGNLEGHLFNAQLEPVYASTLPDTYYTAEFSQTENLGIKGLIVMNAQLFPLSAPFPFYQRKYVFLGIVALSKAKMVDQYNQRLHGTYRLWFADETEKDTIPQ